MKKIRKQILGCFGLGIVAAMTIVAASMPPLMASATSTITDNIKVRVVSTEAPDITIESNVAQNSIIVSPEVNAEIIFSNVDDISIDLDYLGPDEQIHHYDDIYNQSTGVDNGSVDVTLASNKGYGTYTYTVVGTSWNGSFDEETFTFTYAPFLTSAEQDPDDGKTINVTVGPFASDVDSAQIIIDGVVVATVDGPGVYKFSPSEVGGSIYEDRVYDVQVLGLQNEVDEEGNPVVDENGDYVRTVIYRSPIMPVNFVAIEVSPTGTPDTGRFFQNLNISKEDYLITGLIVFFIISIIALGIITRGRKTSAKSHKRK